MKVSAFSSAIGIVAATCACVAPLPSPDSFDELVIDGAIEMTYFDLIVPNDGRIAFPGLGMFVHGLNGCALHDERRGLAEMTTFRSDTCSVKSRGTRLCIDARDLVSDDDRVTSVTGCLRYVPIDRRRR